MGSTDGSRDALSLDGQWRFVADPERLLKPDRLPPGVEIEVPGCWEAQVARPQRIITAWYHRSLAVPAAWQGQRAILIFGAVMYQASVWVNGVACGGHEGGYTSFELDVTDATRWGADNEIVVRVVNPLNALLSFPADEADLAAADRLSPDLPASEIPHGKQTWYASQSGLWQSVRLERRPRTALGPLRITPDVGSSSATVTWALEGGASEPSGGPGPGTLAIALTVSDPAGVIASRTTIEPGKERSGEARLDIASPVLWDIGRPNLYRVEAELTDRDHRDVTIDRIEARFGMREIRTDDGRILLNGRPIYLLGALDQDLYADTISSPPSRAMLDDQIVRARELGLNLLRCHIKIPDPAYLDAADEAGILVWCELPNWMRFTQAAAVRGRETLREMVETLGNHPSIVIWTIINEDWGTRVREEARDRTWLAETYAWLKALDPGRLVVDNSACDTWSTPNFHVRTDLADFHVYHGAPDNASRWRHRIEEFAGRPAWLWSPHGDARSTGDEPLVLSEFGTWGLPRLDRLVDDEGRSPWWFDTGRDHLEPAGIASRFASSGLDRVWSSVEELAEGTQRHQAEALQFEIGELRRHDSIQGYVITELADAYWEANGLLDVRRGPKAGHDLIAAFNAEDVVVVDLPRRDVWAGDRLTGTVHLGSYGRIPAGGRDGGRIDWSVIAGDKVLAEGRLPVRDWPSGGARCVGQLDALVPEGAVGDARLTIRAFDGGGDPRAADAYRLAILPRSAGSADDPMAVAVDDPLGSWRLRERLAAIGHRPSDEAQFRVATKIGRGLLSDVEAGAHALVVVRDRAAIDPGAPLARPVVVRARGVADPTSSDHRSPWDGDWVTAWSWLLPGALPLLPERNPLDFAYAEVMPNHVLAGYDPAAHRDEVVAGIFSGWVHVPAALIWSFPQGRGRLTLTTFRLAPEDGPLATVMLRSLVDLARRPSPAS
ncbi:MAG: hypothetical protein H0V73_12700 [Chloroflexi bacterium]|nr:hypothetical protein [Chloroflexota bacterium]